MKKILLAVAALFVGKAAIAQDTIFWEDFNNVFYQTYLEDFPPGTEYDSVGYVVDVDGLSDGSGSDRPGSWFLTYAFATEDSLTMDGDTNFVMASNSWFSSPDKALNYLITPSIKLNDASGMLHWKTAPFQTPLYLDGYKVLVSTTNNFEDQFTDTLFVAAEYEDRLDPLPDSTYNSYTFSPGVVHGADGSYVVYDGDSARLNGTLRPFSVSLAQYSGQKIFIAFLHDAFDDNLISLDDILITGDGTVDVIENAVPMTVAMYPNPAGNFTNINFNVVKPGPTALEVVDLNGKLVEKRNLGTRLTGQHTYQLDLSKYTTGSYMVTLRTVDGNKTLNLVVGK